MDTTVDTVYGKSRFKYKTKVAFYGKNVVSFLLKKFSLHFLKLYYLKPTDYNKTSILVKIHDYFLLKQT